MPTRSERRRRLRAGTDPQRPLLRRRDLLIACAIAAAVGIGILVVVLISGGSGGDNSSDQSVTETFFPPYSPNSPDGLAIVALARSSIEVLPRGEWPSLYDSFTAEYQQRCPKDQFAAAGEADAQEQGSNLSTIAPVRKPRASVDRRRYSKGGDRRRDPGTPAVQTTVGFSEDRWFVEDFSDRGDRWLQRL